MESIKTSIPLQHVNSNISDSDFDMELFIKDKELYIANDGHGKLPYVDCPSCKNKGFIAYRDHNNYISTKNCKCMTQRKIIERIEKSGLKSSFQKYRFDNYLVKEKWQNTVLITSKNYIQNISKKNWFVIDGAVGSGKSHICTAIVDSLINLGFDIEYIPFISKMPSIQTRISSFYQDTREEAETELERIKNVQLLYIDDFMKTKSVRIDLIFDIIDYRYRNDQLVTIISSELSFDDMKMIDMALASRIKERTEGYWIHIPHSEEKNQRLKVTKHE